MKNITETQEKKIEKRRRSSLNTSVLEGITKEV